MNAVNALFDCSDPEDVFAVQEQCLNFQGTAVESDLDKAQPDPYPPYRAIGVGNKALYAVHSLIDFNPLKRLPTLSSARVEATSAPRSPSALVSGPCFVNSRPRRPATVVFDLAIWGKWQPNCLGVESTASHSGTHCKHWLTLVRGSVRCRLHLLEPRLKHEIHKQEGRGHAEPIARFKVGSQILHQRRPRQQQ